MQGSRRTSELMDLVYELLDAHTDTVVLASNLTDPGWEAHTDYIRALHRRGHEILAVRAREAAYADSVIPARTEPVASNYNEQHIAPGELILQMLSEIHPEWDVVNVHEQPIAPKRVPQPLFNAASIGCAVFTSIRNEDPRVHRAPLRERPEMMISYV